MESEKYNGWFNRETWAYNLWLGNDEGLYREVQDQIMDLCKSYNGVDFIMAKLADWLKLLLEDLTTRYKANEQINQDLGNMLFDIGSQWRINFMEIAEGFKEDIKNAYEE